MPDEECIFLFMIWIFKCTALSFVNITNIIYTTEYLKALIENYINLTCGVCLLVCYWWYGIVPIIISLIMFWYKGNVYLCNVSGLLNFVRSGLTSFSSFRCTHKVSHTSHLNCCPIIAFHNLALFCKFESFNFDFYPLCS